MKGQTLSRTNIIGAALLVWLALLPQPGRAQDAAYMPQAADQSAALLLTMARTALAELELEAPGTQHDVLFNTAVTALTALYQLHGLSWALAPLEQLLARPDATGMHAGYSADGRMLMRIEPLVLKNPEFDDYSVLLCTLESNSAKQLAGTTSSALILELAGGRELATEALTAEHPLYSKLDRLLSSFEPPPLLPSGAGISFKQLFALPVGELRSIQAVRLKWGEYELRVPYYTSEVPVER